MTQRPNGQVIHATQRGWQGVPVEGYRPGAATGVERHTIVGGRKDKRIEPGPSMELRYFELEHDAASRLEKHEHEHVVIVKRGVGYAIIGQTVTEIGPDDVVYVGSMELHQFLNRGEEPFGFYCVVDAARDYSQQPTPEELRRLSESPAGKVAKPLAVPPPSRSAGTPIQEKP